jgi:hypothetical protein
MPTVLIGLVALVLVLWAINGFTSADPKTLGGGARIGRGLAAMVGAARGWSQPGATGFARGIRFATGVLALAAALFIGARGQIVMALTLGAIGAGMLGWIPWNPLSGGRKGRGDSSRVRTPFVEMELDHDTGLMRGTVLSGRYSGYRLDLLELSTVIALQGEFDQQSAALLAAYLDRRNPRWREHAQAGAAAGQGAAPGASKMSEQEAYQILGLEPGAGPEEITRAHHALMKKLHPDQGGSTYLAMRINEARDVLTRTHR